MSKVPYPKTKYYKVKCASCNNEQIVFDSVKSTVKCNVCDEILAKPKGGKAQILGEIIEQYS
ncbi:MAG: 30S ribosomal protein S27e [Candidatus Heimdallarchaeaceae archaeon]|nr:MAG: 30S ribosomal protein S27e [Candidatus Pacearchaeota archaeon]